MTEKKTRSVILAEEIAERQAELSELQAANRAAYVKRAERQLTVGGLIALLDNLNPEMRELPVVWGDDKAPVTEVFVARFRAYALGIGGREVLEWLPQFTAVRLLDKLSESASSGRTMEDYKGNQLRPTMETPLFLEADYSAFTGYVAVIGINARGKHLELVGDDLDKDAK